MSIPQPPEPSSRKEYPKQVEGGGPVGCGCGMLLGAGVALIFALKMEYLGGTLVLIVSVVCGLLGWFLGDSFFEKVLAGGNEDGSPMQWWF
jgi:hypothetical protein